MKHGFVYIWRDRKHNRYYIGSHWGTEDDGYTTGQAWSRNSIKRRPQDFRRKILERNIPRDKLIWNERCWLWFITPDELGKRYYNLNREPMKHWSHDENSKTVKEKLSIAGKEGRYPGTWKRGHKNSKAVERKRSAARRKHDSLLTEKERADKYGYWKGKKQTEASKQKRRGKTPWNKGLKKETDERVAKTGNRTKGRVPWNKRLRCPGEM